MPGRGKSCRILLQLSKGFKGLLLKLTKQSISCLGQEEMTSVHVSLSFILNSAKSQQFPKSSSAIFVLPLPQACVVPSFPVLGYSYKDALSGAAKK